MPLDRKNLPARDDVDAWNAASLESLNALQMKHEELFSSLIKCVQPGASPQLAQTLLPKAIGFMGVYLELLAIADAVQHAVLNSKDGSTK
jgi:hypothetical protein